MKTVKRVAVMMALVMVAAALTAGIAQAENLSLNGTVEAGVKVPVYAPIGGTVETVTVEQGMRVAAGDMLFSYRTEKIYASTDGTVTGVFAQAGDDAGTVADQYGADLYIEGPYLYSVKSSTSKAHSSIETTVLHAGETVWAVCRTDANRKGTGIISAVDGSSYTVLMTEGNFIIGDSVTLYLDEACTDQQRIGRGSIERVNPTAVSTTGAVVRVAVKNGDTVKRGDLLMETLSGTFDGYEMTGTAVTAAEEGVVVSVSAEAGGTVNQGEAAVQIAPVSGMRIEAVITADDRAALKAGDKVAIELESDESKTYEGTVRFITEMPEDGAEEVSYKAIIDFTPDEEIYFGMAVVVTYEEKADTMDAAAEAAAEAGAEAETEAVTEAETGAGE